MQTYFEAMLKHVFLFRLSIELVRRYDNYTIRYDTITLYVHIYIYIYSNNRGGLMEMRTRHLDDLSKEQQQLVKVVQVPCDIVITI